jgi:tight adherence protein C
MITAAVAVALVAALGCTALVLLVRVVRRRRNARQPENAGSSTSSAPTQQSTADSVMESERVARPTAAASQSSAQHLLFSGFGSDDSAANDSGSHIPHLESDDIPAFRGQGQVFGPITSTLAALLPEAEERRELLKTELRNAGYYQPNVWENLAAIRYVGIMASLVVFGGLLVIVPSRFETPVLASIVAMPMLAWALPRFYVKGRAADRISEIENAMPEMLDMLNMCVSQGLTLQDALGRVGRQFRDVSPALSHEMAIVSKQADVSTLHHALDNFSKRVDLPEVHSFTSLLIQTERMGTSVSDALADYSDNMRESLRQRSDTKANQATFKLLFPTVLCLMPAVYLFLLGPALIELSNFFNNGGLDSVSNGIDAVQELNVLDRG